MACQDEMPSVVHRMVGGKKRIKRSEVEVFQSLPPGPESERRHRKHINNSLSNTSENEEDFQRHISQAETARIRGVSNPSRRGSDRPKETNDDQGGGTHACPSFGDRIVCGATKGAATQKVHAALETFELPFG